MPTRLFWRDTYLGDDVGFPVYALDEAMGTSAVVQVSTANSDAWADLGAWRASVGEGIDSTSFPTSFVITARGNGTVRIRVERRNSAGDVLAFSDWGVERASVGTFTETFTMTNSWAPGDLLTIRMQGRRAAGTHGGSTVDIGVNRAGTYVDATFAEVTGQTIAAGTITSQESVASPIVVLAPEPLSLVPVSITSHESFWNTVTFAPQTVTYGTQIVSYDDDESLESPTLTQTVAQLRVYPVAIESVEVFGGHATINRQLVGADGVVSLEMVSIPVSLVGEVGVAPSAIVSEEVLGSVIASPGVRVIEPVSALSQELFGVSTLTPGGVFLSAIGVGPEGYFGDTRVLVGAITLQPNAVLSQEAVSLPTLIPAATVSPPGMISLEEFGSLSFGLLGAISVSGIPSQEQVFLVRVALGHVALLPVAIPSESVFGDVIVLPGASLIEAFGVSSEGWISTPILQRGGVTVLPIGLVSSEGVPPPTVTGTIPLQGVHPLGIVAVQIVSQPQVNPGGVLVYPSAIYSEQSFGVTRTFLAGEEPDRRRFLRIGIPRIRFKEET